MNPIYQPLFEHVTLDQQVNIKNRLIMAPMTNFSSNPDGSVSDAEIDYYARRSHGVGMVITACAYVTANGKGFTDEIAVDRDDIIPSLRRLASAIQEQGAKAILQIFHGGRSCPPELVPNGDVVSASAVAHNQPNAIVPRALSETEIEEIITAFGMATRRAIEAGFDGVEIHGANGYLIQQFFSPHSNQRDDRFGGTLEKRMLFPLSIVDEVQKVVNTHAKRPFLIGYRFSPEETETPGITMADTLQLVDRLADKKLSYLHVSLMDFWSVTRHFKDNTKPRIELIVETVNGRVPVIGVGSIHTADDAIKALQAGVAFLALGRELIMDPDWVKKVEQGQEADIHVTLSKDDQSRLVVPDPLWQAIMHTPGWFPVVEQV
ncbi:MAG: NADH-dependent flavin oxidoreductase [Acidibacillus sp.]|uniref:Oxidoreductase n=1 Tax=Sulfoacidibacillus ferrooxidans TaxID=2005001 RepID=A0A9X2AAR9_9BACL|nr:NADH-dependent flavin oxidoreductase [Sulfoacidibacillus ferrooxidans]MCI0182153.1 putative oxidoreductase [Sulfoacidibacillus ferrooxidans]MCY0894380.1 NADH-dependent flavin oxidoreductase [Acidibacillus sp.]